MKFRYAITRIPADTYPDGITSSKLSKPSLPLTLDQHRAYCEALRKCGIDVTVLPADNRYPDSTFVEDTAIVTSSFAVISNPGADSRRGEISSMEPELKKFSCFHRFYSIKAPGTLDGGDICEAGNHFFIGISERTNESGAEQLAGFLSKEGYTSSYIDIRGSKTLLHLKSGIAFFDFNNLIVVEDLAQHTEFKHLNLIEVNNDEFYAANCIKVNDKVLFAEGFPKLQKKLIGLGYDMILLNMSEFRKMDGGLSCLSLRF